jgi:hypothetical protein
MWPFRKKKPWETEYAENIYSGLVEHNEFGDVSALRLNIPIAAHQAYQNKMLLQREMLCFVALMSIANAKTNLQPVMIEFGDMVVAKAADRGLQLTRDQLAQHALRDFERMTQDAPKWAQQWLSEFRADPNDNFMVILFADHCLRLFGAYQTAIETTKRG